MLILLFRPRRSSRNFCRRMFAPLISGSQNKNKVLLGRLRILFEVHLMVRQGELNVMPNRPVGHAQQRKFNAERAIW